MAFHFYEWTKRLLDVIFALIGLVVCLPLGLLIAIAIKLDSPGSLFFAHERIGKDGRRFRVLKFRSMVQDASPCGEAITVGGDPRITRVGRILRKMKLDELPQFWNVLKGEMSLVGPRPEVERYVALYPEEARQAILSVRPGITGLTQVRFRNEEKILAQAENPQESYERELLPLKIESDLEYLRNRSLWLDLCLLLKTVVVLFESPSRQPSSILK